MLICNMLSVLLSSCCHRIFHISLPTTAVSSVLFVPLAAMEGKINDEALEENEPRFTSS